MQDLNTFKIFTGRPPTPQTNEPANETEELVIALRKAAAKSGNVLTLLQVCEFVSGYYLLKRPDYGNSEILMITCTLITGGYVVPIAKEDEA